MRDKKEGKYRGIKYEIVNWHLSGGVKVWNYYLIVDVKQLPLQWRVHADLIVSCYNRKNMNRASTKIFFYEYEESFFGDLDWHGGITFYEKVKENNNIISYRVGCDYLHYFDSGVEYTYQSVLKDCKNTINSFWKLLSPENISVYEKRMEDNAIKEFINLCEIPEL